MVFKIVFMRWRGWLRKELRRVIHGTWFCGRDTLKKNHYRYHLIMSLAIRYTELRTGTGQQFSCFICRLYHEPEPSFGVLLDDISSLRSDLQNSLNSGHLNYPSLFIVTYSIFFVRYGTVC
uniref:Uncharacterized protein n=1 Tax=Amphimedon queenslandica TaxID=400682 RepID=A0A1X7US53_AMPQE